MGNIHLAFKSSRKKQGRADGSASRQQGAEAGSSFEDERTGQRYFRIEVRVPDQQLQLVRQVRPDGRLQSGLPAEIMIPLRQRTALEYLVEPLTQSLWRAGREH